MNFNNPTKFLCSSSWTRKIQQSRKPEDCSILQLDILVCLRRLEVKEQDTTNYNSVMKEYKSVFDLPDTDNNKNIFSIIPPGGVFEHLLQRQLISLVDNRGHSQSVEFRPVRLLISSHELHLGLKSYRSCPIELDILSIVSMLS
ncbi:origin of replication complex subunit 4-like [Lycium barbarum]|uniref:origin of replication complex subunit 4-like n=1 Tax=Lycium barbarum TaxID=112863 RepID=UPI00293E12F3|nr:origin of replication complex subunit 4-like [Lycium barbarum]